METSADSGWNRVRSSADGRAVGISFSSEESKDLPEAPKGDVHLEVDVHHCYPYMDHSYEQGYIPKIQDDAAYLVVPFIADGALKGDRVTAELVMGKDAPFVYANYRKELKKETYLFEENVEAYVLCCRIELEKRRINGKYPVLVRAHAFSEDGTRTEFSGCIFITISDGVDVAQPPSPGPPCPGSPTEKPPTSESSTERPSSNAPSTDEPTTEGASSDAPPTDEPTTEESSSNAPGTNEPVTEGPPSDVPSNDAPETEGPSSNAPGTDEPTTEGPSSNAPGTNEPVTEGPSSNVAGTDEPITEGPPSDASGTDESATEGPSSNAPSTEEPMAGEPSSEEPATEGSFSDWW